MKFLLSSVLLVFIGINSFAQTFNYRFADNVDLNFDTKSDKISLVKNSANPNKYTLTINAQKVLGTMNDEVDGFDILDITSTDKYKEVVVHTAGPSSDDEYDVYRYDGKNIIFSGKVSRWINASGNGALYVDDWGGFYYLRNKYIIDNITHKLKLIPQEMHNVDIKGVINETFPVYQTLGSMDILAYAAANTDINILVTKKFKNVNYYLIKLSSNLVGWIDEKTVFAKIAGLPMAD